MTRKYPGPDAPYGSWRATCYMLDCDEGLYGRVNGARHTGNKADWRWALRDREQDERNAIRRAMGCST